MMALIKGFSDRDAAGLPSANTYQQARQQVWPAIRSSLQSTDRESGSMGLRTLVRPTADSQSKDPFMKARYNSRKITRFYDLPAGRLEYSTRNGNRQRIHPFINLFPFRSCLQCNCQLQLDVNGDKSLTR